MSLLAPLFLMGAAAIALPILFHLIRRTSREKITFSSLMFLSPTPPRVTKKSRLENILLLLLRCAVICLLALAFARPFLKKPLASQSSAAARRIVVLLDSSASMRRENLWPEAQAAVERVAKDATVADELALIAFDRQARTELTFADWNKAAPGERSGLIAQKAKAISPGWAATRLGNAFLAALELLEHDTAARIKPAEVVLVSDLQEGAQLEGLQGLDWPKNVTVRTVLLKAKRPTNAGMQIVPDANDTGSAVDRIKVRVSNAAGSQREQFQITPSAGQTNAIPIYVPPGQTRTLDVPVAGVSATRFVLSGDDADFDNTAFHVPPHRDEVNIAYIGDAPDNDPQRMLFYLKRAFPETARLKINVVAAASLNASGPQTNVSLIIIDGALSEETARLMATRVKDGATALVALSRAADAAAIQQLTGISVTADEGRASDYAMLAEIDFTHPLFAPFADARFSDFTKIHFWKHRRLQFEASPATRVIARFDGGDPAVAQFSSGRGTVFALTSGWQPGDSQLALSSKFVPLLYSLLEISGGLKQRPLAFVVGDKVDLGNLPAASATTVRKPDATVITLSAGTREFTGTDEPGIYTVSAGEHRFEFAVGLAPEESKTAAMPVEELQRLKVPVRAAANVTATEAAEKQAHLHSAELENRQKLWRWLIAATLVVLMVETWIAARLSRRAAIPSEATT